MKGPVGGLFKANVTAVMKVGLQLVFHLPVCPQAGFAFSPHPLYYSVFVNPIAILDHPLFLLHAFIVLSLYGRLRAGGSHNRMS